MHGTPALSLALPAPGWWRRLVAALATMGAASLAAWAVQAHESLPSWARAGAVAAGALAVAAAWRAGHLPAAGLSWDGRQWRLEMAGRGACAGTLSVALDAGAWMLLRLDAAPGPAAVRRHWLAVSRGAMAGDWHALRCAVYSARPAPGGSSAAASPAPHE